MPTRALMLLRVLKRGAAGGKSGDNGKHCRVCSYADFQSAAKNVGLDYSDKAIDHLLNILSGLGAINWFPEAARDLVVLDPQWLLDSMSALIREHEGLHSQLLDHLNNDPKALPLLKKGDVTKGIFPVKLLDYLWSSDKRQYGALKGKRTELTRLKQILEHFGLISRVRLHREGEETESDECYVVPPLLPESISTDSYTRDYLKYPDAKKCTLLCDFSKKKWLQQSVFQRLVCTMVTRLRSVMPVTHFSLTQRVACMYAGDVVLTLRLHADRWQIEAQTINYNECPHSSRRMLDLFVASMEQVMQVFPKPVPYNVLLSADNGNFVNLSDLENAGAMVCVAPVASDDDVSRVRSQPLKRVWLRGSTDCEFCCCSNSPPEVCRQVMLRFFGLDHIICVHICKRTFVC